MVHVFGARKAAEEARTRAKQAADAVLAAERELQELQDTLQKEEGAAAAEEEKGPADDESGLNKTKMRR